MLISHTERLHGEMQPKGQIHENKQINKFRNLGDSDKHVIWSILCPRQCRPQNSTILPPSGILTGTSLAKRATTLKQLAMGEFDQARKLRARIQLQSGQTSWGRRLKNWECQRAKRSTNMITQTSQLICIQILN